MFEQFKCGKAAATRATRATATIMTVAAAAAVAAIMTFIIIIIISQHFFLLSLSLCHPSSIKVLENKYVDAHVLFPTLK